MELQPDGVVVYDIQDEESRNGEDRPFPFFRTHEPRFSGTLIMKEAPGSPIFNQLRCLPDSPLFCSMTLFLASSFSLRLASALYTELICTVPGSDAIVYRAMHSGETEDQFADWVYETVERGIRNIVLVGGKPNPGQTIISVDQAAAIAKQQERGLLLGGIMLAER